MNQRSQSILHHISRDALGVIVFLTILGGSSLTYATPRVNLGVNAAYQWAAVTTLGGPLHDQDSVHLQGPALVGHLALLFPVSRHECIGVQLRGSYMWGSGDFFHSIWDFNPAGGTTSPEEFEARFTGHLVTGDALLVVEGSYFWIGGGLGGHHVWGSYTRNQESRDASNTLFEVVFSGGGKIPIGAHLDLRAGVDVAGNLLYSNRFSASAGLVWTF